MSMSRLSCMVGTGNGCIQAAGGECQFESLQREPVAYGNRTGEGGTAAVDESNEQNQPEGEVLCARHSPMLPTNEHCQQGTNHHYPKEQIDGGQYVAEPLFVERVNGARHVCGSNAIPFGDFAVVSRHRSVFAHHFQIARIEHQRDIVVLLNQS